MKKYQIVDSIMNDFFARTKVENIDALSNRYLWTDAFALCNFLELYQYTREERYKQMALSLIDDVHAVLGCYHLKSNKKGWISGLSEKEAKEHPTIGGLRIGKPMEERTADEPYDSNEEWDRDGQYFHYLTKWMQALSKTAVVTEDTKYIRFAIELAKTAHKAFIYTASDGLKRMVWKMSTDLSRPLVPSMGQHDPLDAFVTYLQLDSIAKSLHVSDISKNLNKEIIEAQDMCARMEFATSDTLSIGGLLSNSYQLAQLCTQDYDIFDETLIAVSLKSAHDGLNIILQNDTFEYPSEYRLAFRELGLAIGLEALEKLIALSQKYPKYLSEFQIQLDILAQFIPIKDTIEEFWQIPERQQSLTWKEHININSVMLATSLAPNGFLGILKEKN